MWQDKVMPAVHSKYQTLLLAGVTLLHENADTHSVAQSAETLATKV
jgi:hypothetical protein